LAAAGAKVTAIKKLHMADHGWEIILPFEVALLVEIYGNILSYIIL